MRLYLLGLQLSFAIFSALEMLKLQSKTGMYKTVARDI